MIRLAGHRQPYEAEVCAQRNMAPAQWILWRANVSGNLTLRSSLFFYIYLSRLSSSLSGLSSVAVSGILGNSGQRGLAGPHNWIHYAYNPNLNTKRCQSSAKHKTHQPFRFASTLDLEAGGSSIFWSAPPWHRVAPALDASGIIRRPSLIVVGCGYAMMRAKIDILRSTVTA